jgi:predicted TIM-barrel fold metal-dependent hydrolase
MDRLDEFLESYGWATPHLSLTPREYFKRQCWISFDPGERTTPLLAELAGGDRFVWASDFPHSDAKYPGVVDELRERTEGMEPVARAGLIGRNALAMYSIATTRTGTPAS